MPNQAMIDAGGGINVVIEDDGDGGVRVDPVTGAVEIDQPDGGVVVRLNPGTGEKAGADEDPEQFYRNLAGDIDRDKIGLIVDDLMQAIQEDDQSRQQSQQNYARGLELLGLKLDEPSATVGDSASGQDGMSVVTNPLLIENCLKGWATAVGELLPAEGPAKIDNIAALQTAEDNQLAESFERDLNHYLTVLCPEYVPDTSQMLLWGTYFAGAGFKKIYRCPIRRRPVSDSVDRKNLIVSDTTKDLQACERITHVIPMRRSQLKRLQMDDYYLDTGLGTPTPEPNVVDRKVGEIQGTNPQPHSREEDQAYTLWETQCELLLPAFYTGDAKRFEKDGVPLPFLATIDKDNRTLLALRRDWKPDDKECKRKRMYVRYPYVPGPGFYCTGLLNILGNASAALTAAWREALDAGMYASFPGGVISKIGSRQNSSILRPAPGEFVQIETNGQSIRDVVDALPYKDVTPGLMTLIDKITAQAKATGTATEIPIGEGIQNVPVGTMMAYIDQATKIISAAHKGMHTAQSEELLLIVDLFREDPESFWRGNKVCPDMYWNEQRLFAALDKCNLVPRSDPNVPSHAHRLMVAEVLSRLTEHPKFGPLLDAGKILDIVLGAMRVRPDSVRLPPPPPDAPPPPPSPEQVTASAKMIDAQTRRDKIAADVAKEQHDTVQQAQETAGNLKVKSLDLAKELIIHGSDQKNADRKHVMDANKHALNVAKTAHDASMDVLAATKPEPPKGGE